MLGTLCTYLLGFIFLSYLLPHAFLSLFYKTQNLKKKYKAEWALVTGASSGIGKSLATKLASQGLNVVLVALDDELLDSTHKELQRLYPTLQFRKVGVNLGKPGYLPVVAEATKDIPVALLFCNAGYMITGFFEFTTLEQQLANLECNAISGVQLTHHFLAQMVAKKLRGCIVFTSSAAAAIPSPFSCMYAATKAFISNFGAGLASEVKYHGIDVLVFHPSPVATRFYDKAHKLGILEFFKGLAVQPDDLPDAVFASVGRTVWRDIGPTAVGFRLIMKLVDFNLMATLSAAFATMLPDFKAQIAQHRAAKKRS